MSVIAHWADSDWVAAMIAVSLLVAAHPLVAPHAGFNALRCWVALMAASLLGWLVTPATGGVPILLYVVIDTAAAALVLWHPARLEQARIAVLFGAMIASHVMFAGVRLGWTWQGWDVTVAGSMLHWQFSAAIGWVQLGLLAWWSGGDVGRYLRDHFGIGRAGVAGARGSPRS
jgi:hypothetical protein